MQMDECCMASQKEKKTTLPHTTCSAWCGLHEKILHAIIALEKNDSVAELSTGWQVLVGSL
jgi:hypothetical protein